MTDKPVEELKDESHFFLFNNFRSNNRIPGREIMTEIQLRIIRGIEKIRSAYQGKTVPIISHADIIKLAIAFYAGIHPDMMQRLVISPASVSK